MKNKNNIYLYFLLFLYFIILIWSGIKPHDQFTWFLEVVPTFIALPILFFTFKKFRLTNFTYTLIFIHAVILMVGGHYTYALVPIGDWAKEVFGFARNHYDRIGHLAQGFIPAMVIREIVVRKNIIKQKWRFIFIVSMCLAFSAFYEFIEWWVAVASGTAAESFLGTQGDVWDTQWDMFLAFVGSILAQVLFSKLQDKEIKKLEKE